jgi:plastocyanin
MISNRLLCLVSVLTAILLVGQGQQGRAEPAEAAASASQQVATPDQAAMGEVTGRIFFAGTRPELSRIAMDNDPFCEAAHSEPLFAEDGKVNNDGTVPNGLVYVKQGAEKYSFPIPARPVVLDQKGCLFKPHVLGIMAGQELRVLSSDATIHNVHAMVKANRGWNVTQMAGGAPLREKFAQPEITIPLESNLHSWMKAYIGVTQNPFYAVTGKDGTFTIKGLPEGSYTLEAWTATFGRQQQLVRVKANEATTVNFTFKSH